MIQRIRILFSRIFARSADPRLDEEISTHVRMLAREFERRGMSPEQADAAAKREFGPVMRVREDHRAQRRLPLLDSAAQDLRYTLRQLRLNPGFTATAIVTLSLGIGANTAIFDVFDRIVLRGLPVDDPDRLTAVRIKEDMQPSGLPFSLPLVQELNARQNATEGVFASGNLEVRQVSLDGRNLTDPAIYGATGNYFRLIGTQPQIGRVLTESDDLPGKPPVAVISDPFWRREFAARPDALGRAINIGGNVAATIIGVTRPEFYGERLGQAPDVWIPASVAAQVSPGRASRASAWLFPMARLRSDVSLAQAETALATLVNQLVPNFGMVLRDVTDYRLRLVPARQGLGNLHSQFSTPLWLLMGLVTLVVLIACCNLANLLLARGTARTHEIAIRLAIGASGGRVRRQLLTESLVVAGLGGMFGLAIAFSGSHALAALALAGEKQDLMIGFDWRVAAFAAVASIASAFLFGLVPAASASRLDLNSGLQAGRRALTNRGSSLTASKWFAVAQVTISMTLVAGASLLVGSFWNLLHQDMGYRRDGILTFTTAFDTASLSAMWKSPVLRETLHRQLNAVPGVRSAAFLQGAPLASAGSTISVSTPERPARETDDFHNIDVSPHFFETMGTRILAGRAINEDDRAGSKRIAVISETAARRVFGEANPVGRLFTDGPEFKSADAIEVVGVAQDIRYSSLREPFAGIVFLPIAQAPGYTLPTWVIRTESDPLRLVEPVRQALRDTMPDVRIERIQPWSEVVGFTVRQERLLAWLSGAFAGLAILLAAVGTYGVVAYRAERRIPEIGVRLALGAHPRQIKSMMLGEIAMVLALGLAGGACAALALGTWVRPFLFGLGPYDPILLGMSAALLSLVTLAAAYWPARRAARLDPTTALRQE